MRLLLALLGLPLFLRCVLGCCVLGFGTGLLLAASGLAACVMVMVVRAQSPLGLWRLLPLVVALVVV